MVKDLKRPRLTIHPTTNYVDLFAKFGKSFPSEFLFQFLVLQNKANLRIRGF